MLILFVDFYIKAYIKKPKAAPAATVQHPRDDDDHKKPNNGVVTKQVQTNGFLLRNRIDDSRDVKLRS